MLRARGRQRIRLSHSLYPRSPPQRSAMWYSTKLPASRGFEARFRVQFHRPSTCAERVARGEAPGTERSPYWQRRFTGCGVVAEGAPDGAPAHSPLPSSSASHGAVGGEGVAFVVHNDPRGLDAHGCVGTGVGYAEDTSYFSTCSDAIRPSVALQLSPHRNVTETRRLGAHVAPNEHLHLRWSAQDSVGVYIDGTSKRTLASQTFSAPGRSGRLTDGLAHDVQIVYTGQEISVRFDGERVPSLVVTADLAALGAVDAAGDAWVGFTAATGVTSIDADLVSFVYCFSAGCV